jgi:hypothetical protein
MDFGLERAKLLQRDAECAIRYQPPKGASFSDET